MAYIICRHSFLIVTGLGISFRISECLFAAASELGAEPMVLYISPPANPGDDHGPVVAGILEKSNVIITPSSRTLSHCPSMKKALAAGARVGSMTEITEDIMTGEGIEADFLSLKPAVDRLAERFTSGKTIRMSTPAGTSLEAVIEGRRGYGQSCVFYQPGESGGIPDVEVYIAPVEDTVNGRLVIDASCSTIGLVKEPIFMEVRDGRVVEIKGGEEAEKLKELLARPQDPHCYVIAEMAVA